MTTTDEVDRAGMPRRTLYLKNGAYAVMRCSSTGEIQRVSLYERMPGLGRYAETARTSPDGANGVARLSIDYIGPDDPRAVEKWAEADRQGLLVIDPPGDPSRLSAPSVHRPKTSSADPKCTNGRYNTLKWHGGGHSVESWWPSRGFTWYTALPNDSWVNLVRYGMATIDDRWNYCGWPIPARTWSPWGGNTSTYGLVRDGLNTVGGNSGGGGVCGSGAALACTLTHTYWLGSSGPGGQARRIFEMDVFFNMAQCFTGGAVPGCYDVWSVAAHEFLHAYGLDHVDGHPDDHALIMWPYMFDNDISDRYNAAGDITGIGILYPT